MCASPSGDLRPRTLAAQVLGWVEPTTRALVPPVHPSATYERAADGDYPGGSSYTRDENPTYRQGEALLAALEGGEEALWFSSGMAAATTVFEVLEPGDHVIAPEVMYWTLRRWLQERARRGGIELDLVRNGDTEALARALRPGRTRIVWVETPANPTAEITDLRATAERAHRAGALVAADSTLATPVLCRPFEHGVDLVMHSATKQLNGHSDVLAGALVTREPGALWERIRAERIQRGAVLGPFEAWLLMRGMRTLHLRVAASAANTQRVAEFLDGHPAVSRVLYPGLPGHPGHEIAARQMQGGFGSLLSFRVAAGEAAAREVAAQVRVIKRATSLGGMETLIEHRASMEGEGTLVPPDLLRLSVGIEDPHDLLADLEQALSGLG